MLWLITLVFVGLLILTTWFVEAKTRHVRLWLQPLLVHEWKVRHQARRLDDEIELILAVVDHFEPDFGGASLEQAQNRVDRWVTDYPEILGRFRDSDGRPPRHTFCYPIEVYRSEEVEGIASLCRQGYGEVEIHLHHDGDDDESLAAKLKDGVQVLSERHGLLSTDRKTGEVGYAFVHGNWALNNSRPDGRWCGVNDEIRVLRQTGCYADFTFPSAPSPPPPFFINTLYYAESRPDRPCGHRKGTPIGIAPAPQEALPLIQGPLMLNWRNRKWGLIPRLENGCIQASQPATIERLALWLNAGIGVPSRPTWRFVKLYAHGATEFDRPALIGPAMVRFHEDLAKLERGNVRFKYHYVTAREMYNLVKAAEAGWTGSVNDARDFERTFQGATLPVNPL